MIPILYESNETGFSSNGLGRLRDCIRCEATEERNGVYELEFEYPVTGLHYSEIIPGRIIAVEHDETGEVEPFDIYRESRPINGIVTFNAFHISYRQNGIVAVGSNVGGLSQALEMLKDSTKTPNPFSYGTDIISDASLPLADGLPYSVRDFLGGVEGSILDTYGGEYEFTKFQVYLWKARGETRDFTIRYGVNLMDYTDEIDYSETYTSVVPYYEKDETIVIGDAITADGSPYNGRVTCVPLDLTDKFEEPPAKAALEAQALNTLLETQPYLPSRNIKVDFLRLQDSDEYHQFSNLQKCRLCDSVRVIFPRYGMDGIFKIVKVVWDVLNERYTEMELGNLSLTLSEALGIK